MNRLQRNKIAQETRKVYLEQHKKYVSDEVLFQRFLNMVSNPAYFHMKRGDFKGMRILDAGCGNSAYFEVGMIKKLGVSHVTCLDLGKEWIPLLRSALEKYDINNDTVSYVSGSTTNLPFEDESFDMVCSNGVLMHLSDMAEIKKAFAELTRVTKRGGWFYLVLGVSSGFMEEEFLPALRRFYRRKKDFKKLVDSITPRVFEELFDEIINGMGKHTGENFIFSKHLINGLFDVDLCTFIQNIIQAPKRHTLKCDSVFALKMFKNHGFETPLRCRRYVKRKNVRKYFAPLHFDSSSRFSKLLYGEGNLEYIAKRK